MCVICCFESFGGKFKLRNIYDLDNSVVQGIPLTGVKRAWATSTMQKNCVQYRVHFIKRLVSNKGRSRIHKNDWTGESLTNVRKKNIIVFKTNWFMYFTT